MHKEHDLNTVKPELGTRVLTELFSKTSGQKVVAVAYGRWSHIERLDYTVKPPLTATSATANSFCPGGQSIH